MAIQKPLVIIGGKVQQLPIADQLAGIVHDRPAIAGGFFSVAVNSSGNTTSTFSANQLRAHPFIIRVPTSILNHRSEVVTAAAASLYRVGIYRDGGTIYPGSLVVGSDSTANDSATVGIKLLTYASAIVLIPGLYWQVSNTNSATPVLRAIGITGLSAMLGMPITMGANAHTGALTSSLAFAALPSVFPAGATELLNASAPLYNYEIA